MISDSLYLFIFEVLTLVLVFYTFFYSIGLLLVDWDRDGKQKQVSLQGLNFTFVWQQCHLCSETLWYWLLWITWSHSNPWSPFVPAVMCLNAPQPFWWTLCLELLFTPSTPQCHFFSPIQNNEPFRKSTQGSRPSGMFGSPDFLRLPHC